MPPDERATITRRVLATIGLAVFVAACTTLAVRDATNKVSRVQEAVYVSACRPHRGDPGRTPRPGRKYIELELTIAHLGRKPLVLDFAGLQLAASEGDEVYRRVRVREIAPTRRASGFAAGVQARRYEMLFEVPAAFTDGRLLYLGREICRVSMSQ